MDNKLYSIKEVSQILRVTPRYAYELVYRGLLPAIKLGSLKVRPEDIDAFLDKYSGYDLSDPTDVMPLLQSGADTYQQKE